MTDGRSPAGAGCPCCWPPDAGAAWEARRGLTAGATLVDASHFGIDVLACPSCGQHFVAVFTETIDWAGGDDPQATVMLPLAPDEAGALRDLTGAALEQRIEELAHGRRTHRRDHPRNADAASAAWGTGLTIGAHD